MSGSRLNVKIVEVCSLRGGCPNAITLRVEGNEEKEYCVSPLNPRADCGPALLDGTQDFTNTHCFGSEYGVCFYNNSKATDEAQKQA